MSNRNDGLPLTNREVKVMRILWHEGSATVKEAQAILPGEPIYTSVLSIFQTLEDKGHIRHEREGRAYRYFPVTEAAEAQERAVDYVLDAYFYGNIRHMESVVALANRRG